MSSQRASTTLESSSETAQVAGTNVYEAFRNASGTETALPDLEDLRPRERNQRQRRHRRLLDVLGSAFPPRLPLRADTGTTINLGTLARQSEAMALNSQRVAVGYSFDANGVSRAVRFANGGVADLNRLIKPGSGWLLTIANGINDSGWIVGNGTNPEGKTRGFLLRPRSRATNGAFGQGRHDPHARPARDSP